MHILSKTVPVVLHWFHTIMCKHGFSIICLFIIISFVGGRRGKIAPIYLLP